MSVDTLAFKVVVRRVATGSLPFQWQVERDDTLMPVQSSERRFRSMQEAYEAGKTWLGCFLASRLVPRRLPISFDVPQTRAAAPLADASLMNLEDEDDADEVGDEDLMDLEDEDDASVQLDW